MMRRFVPQVVWLSFPSCTACCDMGAAVPPSVSHYADFIGPCNDTVMSSYSGTVLLSEQAFSRLSCHPPDYVSSSPANQDMSPVFTSWENISRLDHFCLICMHSSPITKHWREALFGTCALLLFAGLIIGTNPPSPVHPPTRVSRQVHLGLDRGRPLPSLESRGGSRELEKILFPFSRKTSMYLTSPQPVTAAAQTQVQ